jgi:putative transposase
LKYFFRTVFEQLLAQWNCTLLAYDARQSNVRLWISIHPALNISTLVNNLKTVSSRMVRKRFPEVISRHFKGPQFWQRSYSSAASRILPSRADKVHPCAGKPERRKSSVSPKI